MESWMREHGKPVLFEALSNAWARVEKEYQHAAHDEAVKSLELAGKVEELTAQIAIIDRLEQQNKVLKEELAQLRQSNQQQSKSRPAPRTPLASISVNEPRRLLSPVKDAGRQPAEALSHPELLAEHSKLEDKYRKLRTQLADTTEANERLKEQCREKSKAYEKWMRHAKTLDGQVGARNKKIEKLKAQLVAATNASSVPKANLESGGTDAHTPLPAAMGTPGDEIRNPPISYAAEAEAAGADRTQSKSPSLPPLPEAVLTVAHPAPADESSSDPPVIVAERCVRKRRRGDEPSTRSPAAVKVKREESSDPVVTNERPCFVPQESIDFDNAEERIVTPRKSRHTIADFMASASTRRDQSPSLLLTHGLPAADPETPGFEPHTTHEQEDLEQTVKAEKTQGNGLYDRSSALYPAPRISSPAKPVFRKPKEAKSSRASLRTGIASLAEDGEVIGPRSQSFDDRPINKTNRLENLLNKASPGRETVTFSRAFHTEDTAKAQALPPTLPRRTLPGQTLPGRRELPWAARDASKGVRSAPVTPNVRNPNQASSTARPLPTPSGGGRQKPRALRDRPVSSLTRADFKPNPAFNDGLDYAFNEVIRGKDRASLPGCTREECCGKDFRPVALAMLDTTGPMEIMSFLEDCLEEDAWRLGQLTEREKKDMWVQEKIRELSNKHGRHRERYAGMREPPGWDRMGFPTTQEDAEDRDEGLRREKEEVALRYEDAKRKGRWLFRDEDP